jgi:hypothetical protein
MKNFFLPIVCYFALVQTILGQTARPKITDAEAQEVLNMIKDGHLGRGSLAYRAAVVQRMLEEANYFSDRLKLPTPHPIQTSDLHEIRVSDAWYSTIKESTTPYYPVTVFTTNIFNASIPREQRLHALKIQGGGVIATTNFFFSFGEGILRLVMRINEEGVEYHPPLAKKLTIGNSEAYQLATQYLATVSVDVAALEAKLKPRVWRDQYGHGTNAILAHFFRVGWGEGDTPPVEVSIDGTSKQPLAIEQNNTSFSHRPRLIITNAIELLQIPDPPMKHLERPLAVRTNSTS